MTPCPHTIEWVAEKQSQRKDMQSAALYAKQLATTERLRDEVNGWSATDESIVSCALFVAVIGMMIVGLS